MADKKRSTLADEVDGILHLYLDGANRGLEDQSKDPIPINDIKTDILWTVSKMLEPLVDKSYLRR